MKRVINMLCVIFISELSLICLVTNASQRLSAAPDFTLFKLILFLWQFHLLFWSSFILLTTLLNLKNHVLEWPVGQSCWSYEWKRLLVYVICYQKIFQLQTYPSFLSCTFNPEDIVSPNATYIHFILVTASIGYVAAAARLIKRMALKMHCAPDHHFSAS